MAVAVNDERKWNWLDFFLFIMRTLWISYNASWVLEFTSIQDKWIILLWFIGIYLIPLIFYRPGYIHLVYFFIAESVLTGSMFFFLTYHFQAVGAYDFLFLPLLMIAYVCQSRPLLWIGISTSIAILFIGAWLGNLFQDHFDYIFINLSLLYILGFSLGKVTILNNKKLKLIESIQEKNKALEQYSKRIEELTIMEERNRVSQDLHDTIGHIFTSVITSLDALPFIMKVNQKEAQESIKEIATLARKGLDDIRSTIHQLSPIENQLPLTQSFHLLIKEFMKHTGTKVQFIIEGLETELGERTKNTFIRCLQEGLTNAKRHGQATEIFVTLSFHEEELLLQINDNGLGTDSSDFGFGLNTMKDRIMTLNGTIQFESQLNKGTVIRCSIPIAKEVQTE